MGFTVQVQKKKESPFQNKGRRCLFCVVLAAWPSGKAGDCKSFFPSSNPGVASTTKDAKYLIPFCWYNLSNFPPTEARGGKVTLILLRVLLIILFVLKVFQSSYKNFLKLIGFFGVFHQYIEDIFFDSASAILLLLVLVN